MDTPPSQPLESTTRFSDRAEDYRKYRPTYPAVAIDAILDALGPPSALVAADIGAGTGIAARLLADRGLTVIAVEPNEEMRRNAELHDRVQWVAATGEATGLPDDAVGLVICAQSFHWLDPDRALAEFHRILQPGGRVALMWNDRDDTDDFTRAYGDILRIATDRDPALADHAYQEELYKSPLFRDARLQVFPHQQSLDLDALLGRVLSASYIPKAGPKHDALMTALRSLYTRLADNAGLVHLRYLTRLFLAEAA